MNTAINTTVHATPIYQSDLKRFRVSHSSKSISCARKFEFHKVYPQLKRGEDEYDSGVGHAMHTAYLGGYLVHGDMDRAIWEMMRAYPITATPKPGNPKSLEACCATLEALQFAQSMVGKELVYFELEGRGVLPAVEVPFEIIFPNVTFVSGGETYTLSYIGYIDSCLFDNILADYHVVDLKTHRRTIKDMTAIYANDEQCLPYGFVLEHALGRIIDTFEVTYLSAFIDVLEPKIRAYNFNKGPADIVDWLYGMREWADNFVKYMDAGWFPRKGGEACMAFNKPCQFLNLCKIRDRDNITNQLLRSDIGIAADRDFDPWITMELELPTFPTERIG
jgi:hypothetical protein